MADDFFNKNTDDTTDQSDAADAEAQEEMVKVGDNEYTQEELSRLVELGGMAQEAEEKYNTKLDRVYPEFTKKSQKVKEYEQKLEELEAKIQEGQSQPERPPQGPYDEKAVAEAKQAAKALGLVTDEDFDAYLDKHFRTRYAVERQAEKLVDDTKRLEKELDGKDGRPAFDAEEILMYMQENPGFTDPMKAYKDKYEEQIDAWKEKKYAEKKRPATYTQSASSAGRKTPAPVKITKDNLQSAIREQLGQ